MDHFRPRLGNSRFPAARLREATLRNGPGGPPRSALVQALFFRQGLRIELRLTRLGGTVAKKRGHQ